MKLKPARNDRLTVFVDASKGIRSKGKSKRSGTLIHLGDGMISVDTNIQKYVSLSSTEAEYSSLGKSLKMIVG